MSYEGVHLTDDVLDSLIAWRLGDVRIMPKRGKESKMQRQFTIEIRVDYADSGKNDAMKTVMAAAARHIFATATLLSDGQEPKIVMFSDDFFVGHTKIPLMHDVLGDAIEKGEVGEEGGVSKELLAAMVEEAEDGQP